MSDWFQQALERQQMLQNFRMAMLQQTQRNLAMRGIGGQSFYSPQAVALNAMVQSRNNLPPVTTIPTPNNSSSTPNDYSLIPIPDWVPDGVKSAGGALNRFLPQSPNLAYKFAETSPGKAILDLLSRGQYTSANVAKDIAKGNYGDIPNAAWRGFSGQDKTSYSDVVSTVDPNAPDWAKGTIGFAGDVLLDPTTYIGTGLFGKLGKLGKTEKVGKAATLTDAVTNTAPKVLEGEVVSQGNASKFAKFALEGPKPGNRIFVGSPSGDVSISAPDVLRTAQAASLTDQIKGMPKLLHPEGLSVSPLFKDFTETATRTVPVTKQIEIVPKASDSARLANLRAIKLSLLQAEDYTINGFKVRDILRSADATSDPAKLKMIDQMFNTEATKIYKSGDLSKLPSVGEKAGPGAKLYGRGGEKAPIGLTLNQASHLLHSGEVGGTLKSYGTASDEFLSKFPIHSVDDLENVHVHNSSGKLVPLQRYLLDLGITPKAVDAAGNVKEATPFRFDFEQPVAPKKKTVTRVVHETVTTQVTKSRRLNPAETIAWMSKHAGMLSKEEMAYLRRAGSRASFEKRLGELKAKVVVGDFKTLDDVIHAAEQGLIPKDSLQKLLDIAGASSLKDLRSKALDIINKTGPRPKEAAMLKPPVPKTPPKVERLKAGATGEDPFAVKPAEQLVVEGTPEKVLPKLDARQIEDVANALGYAVVENVIKPLDPKIYPFVTDIKKALRTHKTPGVGRGRNFHGWNAMSQSDVWRKLISRASGDFKATIEAAKNKSKAERSAVWATRATVLYDRIVPELRAVDSILASKSVKYIAGTDNEGLLLSLTDVIDALPRPLVERYLFTPASSVYPTSLLNAAASIAKSVIEGTSADIARLDAYNAVVNALHKSVKKPDVFASQVVSDLMDHSAQIVQKVEENYAREALKLGTSVTSMTDPVIKTIATELADPRVSMGKAFGDFAVRSDEVAAIGRKVNAPAGAAKTANALVDAKLASAVDPGDIAEGKAAKEFAAKPGDPSVARQQYAARAAVADSTVPDVVDIGQKYEARINAALFKAEVPLSEKIVAFTDAMGEAFVPHFGHRDLHEALRTRRVVSQDFSRTYSALMGNIWEVAKTADATNPMAKVQEAFRSMQDGIAVTDPALQRVVEELQQAVDVLFGHATKSGLGHFAQRNGFTVDHLNRTMEFYGVPAAYHFNPASSILDQAEIWRKWPTDNVLDMLDKTHAALQRASIETTLGASFSHEFGVATARPGFVKIVDSTGRSYIAQFIDKSLYYPREIVDQLKYLDKTMRGSFGVNRFNNAGVDAIVRNVYDPAIHAWKSGMTIWRPGHHISNMIGDITLSWYAGVNSMKPYRVAARVMGHRSSMYGSWDGLKALMDGTALDKSAATGKGIHVKINGKKTFISDDEVWRGAWNQAVLPEFRTLEDVAYGANQTEGMSVSKGLLKPFSFGQRKLGGLSQARDHYVRIAHFVDVLQRKSYATLDDAMKAAGAEVRKWHPDGSDLSNFEGKYMRRMFMFYSWQRKAIPLVIETLVKKPGKALVMPKAMHNFAIAMGIEPDSLSNPFPNDQLFPSFLTDGWYGPQWQGSIPGVPGTGIEGGNHYRGVNWPDPVTQIMGQYGGKDASGQVLGSLTPALRVPLEMSMGNNIRTGGEISNPYEYLDSQIPGAGYFDKITGHTLTGLGTPTKDVQKGNVPPGFNSTAFFNWLTGLGMVDYSKPNYRKTAEFELRDKLRGK